MCISWRNYAHCWCQWNEECPIIGVSGSKNAPLLVSVEGISASSLVSVEGKMPHSWCQWEEQCPITGVNGRENAPLLV
ncbi:unnamed protein product [Staurois parvus]|uniref:Uncharacterized protein n=1 Tax=Staurois parvus TaxID=386267 RepID=A0ABN9D7T8_9NEOB|nr:unnamed protein product [Staurois parvus]